MKKPKFDSHVSIPKVDKGPEPKYSWLAEMEIGQSFLTDLRTARTIHANCYKGRKYLPDGFRVSIKKEGDKTRVWRIA